MLVGQIPFVKQNKSWPLKDTVYAIEWYTLLWLSCLNTIEWHNMQVEIGRSTYHFSQYIYIYIHTHTYTYTFRRDTQRCSTDCLLMHRCQLYTFRTVTAHPQELLFRCCMCRLWYVVRTAPSDTSSWYNVWGRTSSSNVVPAGHIR